MNPEEVFKAKIGDIIKAPKPAAEGLTITFDIIIVGCNCPKKPCRAKHFEQHKAHYWIEGKEVDLKTYSKHELPG